VILSVVDEISLSIFPFPAKAVGFFADYNIAGGQEFAGGA
jgi:hypothetical protein